MYRVWLAEILGFRLRGNQLSVDPTLPKEWKGFTVRYRYRNMPYEIIVENPDHVNHGIASLELDGQPTSDKTLCLEDDGAPHTPRIRLGWVAPPNIPK